MTNMGTPPGPATLALVLVGAAIVAVLIGWAIGRGQRRTGVVAAAVAFAILGGGGLMFAGRTPPRSPQPAATPVARDASEPVLRSKAAGGTLDSVRKSPSVGAADLMMMWMLRPAERVDFCVKRMKHFAEDCRDAVAAMADMRAPVLPDTIRRDLTGAVRDDLLNKDTAMLAEAALEAARAAQPDELLSYPSPGGTDADVYWCEAGGKAGYERAVNDAVALAVRSGLKFPDGPVVGRVRVLRSDQAPAGDVVNGDAVSPAAKLMIGLIAQRTGRHYVPGKAVSGGRPLAFYSCG